MGSPGAQYHCIHSIHFYTICTIWLPSHIYYIPIFIYIFIFIYIYIHDICINLLSSGVRCVHKFWGNPISSSWRGGPFQIEANWSCTIGGRIGPLCYLVETWLVVSNIFYFHPFKLGKISNLTNIFQIGWNHQLETFSMSTTDRILHMLLDLSWQGTSTGSSQQAIRMARGKAQPFLQGFSMCWMLKDVPISSPLQNKLGFKFYDHFSKQMLSLDCTFELNVVDTCWYGFSKNILVCLKLLG